jgi:hypothetical protein
LQRPPLWLHISCFEEICHDIKTSNHLKKGKESIPKTKCVANILQSMDNRQRSSEKSVDFQQAIWRYVPEEGSLRDHCCGNLIFYNLVYFPAPNRHSGRADFGWLLHLDNAQPALIRQLQYLNKNSLSPNSLNYREISTFS